VTELIDFLDAEYGLQRGEAAWRESAIEAGEKLTADLGMAPAELRRKLVADRGMRLLAVKQWLRVARAEARSGDSARASGSAGVDTRARDSHIKQVLPGTAMYHGFRIIGILATVFGLILGLGTARAALSSAPGEPVNLWLSLGMLVLLQVGFLLGAILLALVAKARGRQWLGAFTNMLKWLHRWSWAKRVSSSEMLQALPRTQKVERWIWLGLTQRFAVSFNFGALLMFVGMLLFTELQFGWATTPSSIGVPQMNGLVQMLAAPWGWAFPASWVPNENVIAATQWNSLSGSFFSPNADGRVWWPFVMMNLLIWGLIPRIVLLRWAHDGKCKQLARLDWNHRRLQDLFEVMLPPSAAPAGHTDAGSATGTESATAARARARQLEQNQQPIDGLVMVAWGAWQNDLTLQAGGRDLAADAALVSTLGERQPNTIQVVVEAGEAPDKRFTSFLAQLRSAVGRACLIQVCPIELSTIATSPWLAPSDRDLLIWRRTLATLRDDHLHVSATPPSVHGGA
jgi:hypothetical protein